MSKNPDVYREANKRYYYKNRQKILENKKKYNAENADHRHVREQANGGCEMLHKVYEYEGEHYCEEDISLTDPLYCGDVWDLYWKLKQEGHADETSQYYSPEDPDIGYYDDEEDLVLNNLDYFGINVCEEYDDEENENE